MSNKKQEQQSSLHFLATITGCMLLLAGTATAHTVAVSGENIRHSNVLTHSTDGKLQHAFRQIRSLVSFFLNKEKASGSDQTTIVHYSRDSRSTSSGYTSVFSYKVRHVKNQEIHSWLLRV